MERIDITDLTLEQLWQVSRTADAVIGCLDVIFPIIDVDMDIVVGDVYGIAEQILAERSGYCE